MLLLKLSSKSAPAHKSVAAMAVVHDCGFELVDHPPYLALFDYMYFLFPNMKILENNCPGKIGLPSSVFQAI